MPPKDLGTLRFAASGGDDSSPQAWVPLGPMEGNIATPPAKFCKFRLFRLEVCDETQGYPAFEALSEPQFRIAPCIMVPGAAGWICSPWLSEACMPIPICSWAEINLHFILILYDIVYLFPTITNYIFVFIMTYISYHSVIVFFRTPNAIGCFQLLRSRTQDIEDRFGNNSLDRHRPEIWTC